MEGRKQKDSSSVRDERDEQGEDHQQKISDVSHERKTISIQTQPSFPGQHPFSFPRSLKFVSHYGLPRRRRSSLPFGQQTGLQLTRGQIFHGKHDNWS